MPGERGGGLRDRAGPTADNAVGEREAAIRYRSTSVGMQRRSCCRYVTRTFLTVGVAPREEKRSALLLHLLATWQTDSGSTPAAPAHSELRGIIFFLFIINCSISTHSNKSKRDGVRGLKKIDRGGFVTPVVIYFAASAVAAVSVSLPERQLIKRFLRVNRSRRLGAPGLPPPQEDLPVALHRRSPAAARPRLSIIGSASFATKIRPTLSVPIVRVHSPTARTLHILSSNGL